MATPIKKQEFTAEELLQAQAQVFHHVYAQIGAMSLNCAIELDIPGIIAKHGSEPMPLSNLISSLPISAKKAAFLPRLMRILTHMGYFVQETASDKEVAYSITPLSKVLLKDSPTSLSSWVTGMLHPYSRVSWHRLSDWFLEERFNETMAGDSRLLMKAVVTKCEEVFRGLKTLVDVGGGTGTSARTIAEAFPHIKCTVFDLPHVIADMPESPLVDAVAGNMFEYVPKADAIFMKLILHDWTDEDCVKILKKCKEAVAERKGKVIIVDIVLDSNKEDPKMTETQLFWDMVMMAFTGGLERNEDEWKNIFNEAGFSSYKITPLGVRSLIEVFP
ncbi:O-methyltransferase COMT-type protein [Dioscorea alata]|uniref:O-methyltransferase COMT-type protein n=1 Tax=Dioscorea alata TaxID=55571 RepID=A0ACB7TTE1_DIOAL|nr:O-methyltransferase COMT-type protein [Dioscorea alata]